jgi:hypothetical protein
MKNFDIGFEIKKVRRKRYLTLNKSTWPRRNRKYISINDENFLFTHGDGCLFVYREGEPTGIKFFITGTKRSRKMPGKEHKKLFLKLLSLERVKEMFKIQKILYDNDLSTEPKEIVTCSINNEKTGYGIIMERAILDETATYSSKETDRWFKRFVKIINENDITFKSLSKRELLKGPRRLKKESMGVGCEFVEGSSAGLDGANLILTEKGYMLIDMDQARLL